MRTQEIIDLAKDLRRTLGTKNPFEIAEHFGIKVSFWDSKMKDFTARIIKADGYQPVILISSDYTEVGRKVLCAHELGHALLHEGINHFKVTSANMNSNVEYEANLFAVALLFEQEDLTMRMEKMSNSTLKILLDYNLSKSN